MGSPSMAAWSTLRTTQHVAYRWVSRGLQVTGVPQGDSVITGL